MPTKTTSCVPVPTPDFSKPGKYRVQLSYENGEIADAKNGEWVGEFTGPVFELNVVP